jgi:hypothetical protein
MSKESEERRLRATPRTMFLAEGADHVYVATCHNDVTIEYRIFDHTVYIVAMSQPEMTPRQHDHCHELNQLVRSGTEFVRTSGAHQQPSNVKEFGLFTSLKPRTEV